jgi:hypothetical protein
MAHDDRELIPRSAVRDSSERGLYLVVGVIVVIALAGLYVVIGTPGLRTQIARAPVATEAGR